MYLYLNTHPGVVYPAGNIIIIEYNAHVELNNLFSSDTSIVCSNQVSYHIMCLWNFWLFISYRSLRNSVAGKMVINITVPILTHQLILIVYEIGTLMVYSSVIPSLHPIILPVYLGLLAYFGSVLTLLFAAEAINLFTRIVLVFPEINHYVLKATLTAWST